MTFTSDASLCRRQQSRPSGHSEQPYEGLTNLNKEGVAVKAGEVQENSWRFCKVQPPMKESNYPLYSDTSEDHPYIDHTEDQLPFGESLNGTKAWSYPFR
ncbi:hypothetical protein EI555_000248 [Monodon monoceros]|uniref:Uncharacterized protein n=1 Tax=Monodon monoceros TaxID=40151 RepID=A0A4U1F3F2_MONMO|nr:hypothetical protein EI555_000248 [Monodon monoceros]